MSSPQWYELGNFPASLILWLYSFTFSLNLPHWIYVTSVISSEVASVQNSFFLTSCSDGIVWELTRDVLFARLAVQGACFLIWQWMDSLFYSFSKRREKPNIRKGILGTHSIALANFQWALHFSFCEVYIYIVFTKQKKNQGTTSPTQAVFFNVILWCVWYANISYIEDFWNMIWIKPVIF